MSSSPSSYLRKIPAFQRRPTFLSRIPPFHIFFSPFAGTQLVSVATKSACCCCSTRLPGQGTATRRCPRKFRGHAIASIIHSTDYCRGLHNSIFSPDELLSSLNIYIYYTYDKVAFALLSLTLNVVVIKWKPFCCFSFFFFDVSLVLCLSLSIHFRRCCLLFISSG